MNVRIIFEFVPVGNNWYKPRLLNNRNQEIELVTPLFIVTTADENSFSTGALQDRRIKSVWQLSLRLFFRQP